MTPDRARIRVLPAAPRLIAAGEGSGWQAAGPGRSLLVFEISFPAESGPDEIQWARDWFAAVLMAVLRGAQDGGGGGAGGGPPRNVQPIRQSDMAECLLTPHEIRLLKLMAEGHAYKTAAAALGVSSHTVSFHLRRVYQKLDVHSKSEAISWALRQGFL